MDRLAPRDLVPRWRQQYTRIGTKLSSDSLMRLRAYPASSTSKRPGTARPSSSADNADQCAGRDRSRPWPWALAWLAGGDILARRRQQRRPRTGGRARRGRRRWWAIVRLSRDQGSRRCFLLHRPIIGGGEMYLDGEEQCDDEGVRE